ncbi:MAG: dienelactone hydrolase family protein [Planctomycetaceae bacterium]|nr:dienelactone hydrolase family protein [Planctomycetaceae bacterium]
MRWFLGILVLSCCGYAATGTAQDAAAERPVDVEWLSEVTTAPQSPSLENPGTLHPILKRSDGSEVSSLEGWTGLRASIREQWMTFLGPMPEFSESSFQVLRETQENGFARQLIQYQSEPGQLVQAYLLLPDAALNSGRPKLPGIVALHQTTDASIDEIAGVSGRDAMQIGRKLALEGYVVICPRCFLWQDVSSLNEAVAKHRQRHPNTTGMAKMLHDAKRATDVLAGLDNVDPKRIGAIGHSLGAKEVLYLAAFDQRISAAVSSEGGLGFRTTNWDAPWYLGEAIRAPEFPLNHHQLLALIAPRPFLVVGGESGPGAADGDRSWVIMNAALPAWSLYPSPARLGLLNHHQGHSIPDEVYVKMSEWLRVYLQ